jgi:glycerol-3-phosphate cytidylyltransferase-like family protein
MREKIIIVCGSFDLIDVSDIEFLKAAKKKGDWLIVGLYSDAYLVTYESGFAQNYETRSRIIKEIKCVDEVFLFNDSDGTFAKLLMQVKMIYPECDYYFVSKKKEEFPETKIKGIKFISV